MSKLCEAVLVMNVQRVKATHIGKQSCRCCGAASHGLSRGFAGEGGAPGLPPQLVSMPAIAILRLCDFMPLHA